MNLLSKKPLKIITLLILFVCISIQGALYLKTPGNKPYSNLTHQIKIYAAKLFTQPCELFSSGMDACNKGCDYISKAEFINLIESHKSILEIGAFSKPASFSSNKVKYFDVFNKQTLIENAKREGLDPSTIPEIDYTHPQGDLSIITEKFDVVFSSHNIEHQVDLIKHLQQVSAILNDSGEFYLLIPDKRSCFDHYIPETAISEVLATHYSDTKTHDLRTILAGTCETAHNNPARHWIRYNGVITAQTDKQCYIRALEKFNQADGRYLDSHKWRFTPSSFEVIVDYLHEMGLSPFKVKKIYCTNWGANEFSAILYKP